MKTTEFTYLLQHPTQLSNLHTTELEKLILAFPYFQSARSLFLKGLKDQESFRYNQELKTTAAYTTDRSVLFDFITSPLFNQVTPDKETTKKKDESTIQVIEPEEVQPTSSKEVNQVTLTKTEEVKNVLNSSSITSTKDNDATKSTEDTEKDIRETSTEAIQPNAPLSFNKEETHSFAEWLKLTSLQPIQRDKKGKTQSIPPAIEEKEDPKTMGIKDKFDLIDEFISSNPKIQPASKSASTRNLAEKNLISTEELMTETLAKVYLAQKNYKKAIQAYNILILKNPEKSGFFADQIRAIKKIQENK